MDTFTDIAAAPARTTTAARTADGVKAAALAPRRRRPDPRRRRARRTPMPWVDELLASGSGHHPHRRPRACVICRAT
eukprot:8184408-Heterocapsa_arctica.AAC.1